MAAPKPPEPVTLIVGMLSARADLLDAAERELAARFGAVALRSPLIDFVFTDYYEREMGRGLKRQFVSFAEKIDPGRLAAIKLETNAIEADFARRERTFSQRDADVPRREPDALQHDMDVPRRATDFPRPVNLDPGYVCGAKLVLASAKDHAHRIYLGQGVYAEITLVYRKGQFTPVETTYPDYRSREYIEFFTQVRQRHVGS